MSSISISGSGFDTNSTNNLILIGGIPCVIKSSTSTFIVCSAGENPIGTYYFKISVLNKGYAQMNVNSSVSFNLEATSISPTSSGTGGIEKILLN